MKFEHTRVMNFEGALRGMRNPLASWHRSDSYFEPYCEMDVEYFHDIPVMEIGQAYCSNMVDGDENAYEEAIQKQQDYLYDQSTRYTQWGEHTYEQNIIGPNDMDLAKRLIAGGPEHRKFLRQIFVSVDITAPLYWWKEFDTYKVGTTANSTSTMHKLASTPITLECFETDDFDPMAVIAAQMEDIPNNILYDFIEYLEGLRQKYNETKDKRYWKELVRWLPNGWLQTRTVTMNYENLRTMYHQRQYHKLTEWHQFCEWVKSLPYAKEFITD